MAPEFVAVRHADGYEAAARWWAGGLSQTAGLPGHEQDLRSQISEANPRADLRNARGAVLYLHGIQSHGEWFERSGARLAEAGFCVLMPDRRGSGRNERDRGHAETAEQLVADAVQWLDEARRRAGCERVHVVGVSWGGKLAINLFQARPQHVASLALVAPGLFPIVDLSIGRKLHVAWSALAGPRDLFDIPINEPEMFTANPRWIEYLHKDPLRLRQVTASFLIASRRLDRFTRTAHRQAGPPIALFLAEHDRIIDNEKTGRWLRELPWPERRLTEYRGAHHTLEFEPEGCAFVEDLAGWVTQCRGPG